MLEAGSIWVRAPLGPPSTHNQRGVATSALPGGSFQVATTWSWSPVAATAVAVAVAVADVLFEVGDVVGPWESQAARRITVAMARGTRVCLMAKDTRPWCARFPPTCLRGGSPDLPMAVRGARGDTREKGRRGEGTERPLQA